MLDRDTLARDFAVALTGRLDSVGAVERGFHLADQFLALASTPTPPPRESGTGGEYEPRVGDVVIGLFCDDDLARVDSTNPLSWSLWNNGAWKDGFGFGLTSTARPATASERAAAGLPPAPAPAPVAERPEWVRYAKAGSNDKTTPRRVLSWSGDIANVGSVGVGGGPVREDRPIPLDRDEWVACAPPCPPPPPADARVEAYKALLAYAECEEAYCGPLANLYAVIGRHGGTDPEQDGGTRFIVDLRKRALALARKAEGGA